MPNFEYEPSDLRPRFLDRLEIWLMPNLIEAVQRNPLGVGDYFLAGLVTIFFSKTLKFDTLVVSSCSHEEDRCFFFLKWTNGHVKNCNIDLSLSQVLIPICARVVYRKESLQL